MAGHFTYRVSWSEEDGEYVGTCAEFSSLSHWAAGQDGALRGIRSLVAVVVADMRANNEAIPEPLAEGKCSGNFQTRIPSELHRQLAIEAAEAGVSLNRLVSLRLAVPLAALFRVPTPRETSRSRRLRLVPRRMDSARSVAPRSWR